MYLGDIVPNGEGWLGASEGDITAEELDPVRNRIVIVIYLETQTELGNARPVDEGQGGVFESRLVPVAGQKGFVEDSTGSKAGGSMEVG